MSTLSQSIRAAKDKHGIALMPFVAAGYPDLETSIKLLPALQRGGAAAIEIGFPFSDPVADGPTIQEAFTLALSKKLKVNDIFAALERAKTEVTIPMVAMVSYSIVFRFGVAAFIQRCKQSGITGLLIPDLPPPEAEPICKQAIAGGLETVLLVSPSTPESRRGAIASLCTGFVYYLSLAGITGERDKLPAGIEENVTAIKKTSQVPVCVGFGISKPEHVRQLASVADGAIVGSALVKRVGTATDPAKEAEVFCKELLT